MKMPEQVQQAWKALPRKLQRSLRDAAQRDPEVGFRLRCKIIINLVRGCHPRDIHRILHCSLSQIYRVAGRFLDEGPSGLADKREHNGPLKVTEEYEWRLLLAVLDAPTS